MINRTSLLRLSFVLSLVLVGLFFSPLSHGQILSGKVKNGDPLPANLFIELAKNVNPTVVNIFTTYLPKGRQYRDPTRDPFMDLFEQFMGPQGNGGGARAPQQSLGTGFIIREDGLIVTNNHVIDHADVIKVQISENTKESFDAKIVGKDSRTDIALIKIEPKRKLPYAKLGSSSQVEVGEWVAAFGNPYGYGHTMTKGIISAVGRELDDLNLFPFMQTDASINPGNSGGPLVNSQGLVIGVNTAIDARAQGIGFVIPIDNVKSILPQLEKDGGVERGFIGVNLADIDEDGARSLNLKQTDGALITRVMPGSPAERGGLQPYDLVVEFGGTAIASSRDLSKAVLANGIGKRVPVKVVRNGKQKTLTVQIGGNPEEKAMKMGGSGGGKNSGGMAAPFNLGFSVADYSLGLAQQFDLPKLGQPRAVVVSVNPHSEVARSGLEPGDIILDVNRNPAERAKDVIRNLKKGINILRVLKGGDRVVLISLRA